MCDNIYFIMLKKILKKVFNQLYNSILIVITCILLWSLKCNYERTLNKISTLRDCPDVPVMMWWNIELALGRINCPSGFDCMVLNRPKNISDHYNVDAYLFYGSKIEFNDLPLPRRPQDTIWALLHEESPRNVEEFLHEKLLNIFNYSATFSRHSDSPFPLQYLRSLEDVTNTEYFVETAEKNMYLDEIAPIMYLQSDCETSTERDAYVKELMKLTPIDSYGACLKNKDLPHKFTEDYLNRLYEHDFLKYTARYKFVIAIENGVCDDYITEKLWRPITVGSVPIYFGSPSVGDWLPNNKSAILLKDFPTPQLLYEHIQKLMNNDSLYEEYLVHKTKQVITNNKLTEELRMRPYQTGSVDGAFNNLECLICESLYKKREGKLGAKIVNKLHYNCPKPISALTLAVNPRNSWVYTWETAKEKVERIYEKVMSEDNNVNTS